jgi:energy-coupling factor transporter ATP-binding protein EcfA2
VKVTVRGIGAIRDVSFSLDKTTVITGNNGTGKTTLLLTLYALINAWAKEVKMKSLQVDDNFKKALSYTFKRSIEETFRSDVKEIINGEGEVIFEGELGTMSVKITREEVNVGLALNKDVKFEVREVENKDLPVGEIQVNVKGTTIELVYGSNGKEKYQYFDLLKDLLKDVEGNAVVNSFLDLFFLGLRPAALVTEAKGEAIIRDKKVTITDFGVFIDGKKYPVTSHGLKRIAEIVISSKKGELVLIDDAEVYLDEEMKKVLVEEVVNKKKVIMTTRDKSFSSMFDNVVNLS